MKVNVIPIALIYQKRYIIDNAICCRLASLSLQKKATVIIRQADVNTVSIKPRDVLGHTCKVYAKTVVVIPMT